MGEAGVGGDDPKFGDGKPLGRRGRKAGWSRRVVRLWDGETVWSVGEWRRDVKVGGAFCSHRVQNAAGSRCLSNVWCHRSVATFQFAVDGHAHKNVWPDVSSHPRHPSIVHRLSSIVHRPRHDTVGTS